MIHHHLLGHLQFSDVLSSRQNGFLPGRSTEKLLIPSTDIWKKAIDDGEYVGLVMLDLRKAFATVDHLLLIEKLNAIGVKNEELRWFSSYLTGRTQQTKWRTAISMPDPVRCGVPQGSILGPLLVLVYINDLLSLDTKSVMYCYCDDTSIFIQSKDPKVIIDGLNIDLEKISSWMDIRLLPDKNQSKKKSLCFSEAQQKPFSKDTITSL